MISEPRANRHRIRMGELDVGDRCGPDRARMQGTPQHRGECEKSVRASRRRGRRPVTHPEMIRARRGPKPTWTGFRGARIPVGYAPARRRSAGRGRRRGSATAIILGQPSAGSSARPGSLSQVPRPLFGVPATYVCRCPADPNERAPLGRKIPRGARPRGTTPSPQPSLLLILTHDGQPAPRRNVARPR